MLGFRVAMYAANYVRSAGSGFKLLLGLGILKNPSVNRTQARMYHAGELPNAIAPLGFRSLGFPNPKP